jgi:serine/threonine protein kinase
MNSEPILGSGLFSSYQRLEKLGEGTYGIVYKAVHRLSGAIVALKIIRPHAAYEGLPATMFREIAILRSLSHPSIIRMHEIDAADGIYGVAFDFIPHDLSKLIWMQKGKPLNPELCRSYAYQILCAVTYLHLHRILHRDIKPSNILLDDEGLLKLCDFGLSRRFSIPLQPYSPDVVTHAYRAPELFLHNEFYELGIDVWSAGCVIAEMVRGGPLFPADSDIDVAHRVFKALGTPPADVLNQFADIRNNGVTFPMHEKVELGIVLGSDDHLLIDLLARMLAIDPHQRISAIDALNHPYFNQLSKTVKRMCRPIVAR